MKKLLKSSLVSGIVLAILNIINLIGYNMIGHIPISIPFSGGECIDYIGPGLSSLTLFSFGPVESATHSSELQFNPIIFIILFVAITFIVWLILTILNKKHNKVDDQKGE